MRFSALLCVACLSIGFSWPLPTQAESVLDTIKKDPQYRALTPDQQKRFDGIALDFLVEQFELFTNCHPLAVTISEASQDWDVPGLTKADIQNAVESRLRGAHIYAPTFSLSSLNISIFIMRGVFSINLGLLKSLADGKHSQMYGAAKTWEDGVTGAYVRGVGGGHFILSSLSQLLDRFIANYLRVNETACAKKKRGSSDEMRQRPQASPGPRDGGEVE